MADKERVGKALDWVDPLGIFPHRDKDQQNKETMKYGPVVGFGYGEVDRQTQQNYIDHYRDQGVQATYSALDAAADANAMTDTQRELMHRGGRLQQRGVTDLDNANRGFTHGVSASQAAMMQQAASGQSGILSAAARPQHSFAQAQQNQGLAQAAREAQSMAATMSRGGNSALAQRTAQQGLLDQSYAAAQQGAMLRAQEEAAIRNSQIQAAQAAGALGQQAAQASGQLGLAGAQGVAGVGAQRLGAGTQQQQQGAEGIQRAIESRGAIALEAAKQQDDLAYNYGTAQTNADTGYAAAGAQQQAAREGGNAGLLGGLLGGLFGG